MLESWRMRPLVLLHVAMSLYDNFEMTLLPFIVAVQTCSTEARATTLSVGKGDKVSFVLYIANISVHSHGYITSADVWSLFIVVTEYTRRWAWLLWYPHFPSTQVVSAPPLQLCNIVSILVIRQAPLHVHLCMHIHATLELKTNSIQCLCNLQDSEGPPGNVAPTNSERTERGHWCTWILWASRSAR